MPRKKREKKEEEKKSICWFNFPNNFRISGFNWIYFMEL